MFILFSLIGLGIMLGLLALIGFGAYALYKKMFESAKPESSPSGRKKANEPADNPFKDTLLFRVFSAIIFILISLIPLSFVGELVSERGSLYNSVSNRMTQEWSGPQMISGPILSIPYQYTDFVMDRIENKLSGEIKHEKREVKKTKVLFILPDTLNIETNLKTKELSRGIYSVPIYNSENALSGTFKWPDLTVLNNKPEVFLWNKAKITFLVSETKGIEGGTELIWNKSPVGLSSGTGLEGVNTNYQGVHARLDLSPNIQSNVYPFEFKLNLRGSRAVSFAPTGRESQIALNANWGDPSFEGELLPTTRDIQADNFNASWNVTHLARTFQQFKSTHTNLSSSFLDEIRAFNFGASLFQTVDLYSLLERTTKYGIMFVSLTFFALFIIELASGARMHWLQHLIIGAALSMFYLCVLAFSEHIPFGYAYMIGVAIITAISGIYLFSITKKIMHGLSLGGVMIALYAVLYSILQMEDFALLIGTLLLLTFLIFGMYITRNMHHSQIK